MLLIACVVFMGSFGVRKPCPHSCSLVHECREAGGLAPGAHYFEASILFNMKNLLCALSAFLLALSEAVRQITALPFPFSMWRPSYAVYRPDVIPYGHEYA